MKINKVLYLMIAVITTCVFTSGCDNGNAIKENTAYINDAFFRKVGEIYLEVYGETRASIPVNISRQDNTRDITVTVDVAAKELEDFNRRYNRDYVLYPTDMWSFDNQQATIRKGSAGSAVGISIKAISEELASTGDTYAIPVKIVEADGLDILPGSDTYIYVLRKIPVATVAQTSGSASRLKFKADHLGERLEFTQLTIEFLMKIESWTSVDNHGLFYNNGKTETGGGQIFSRLEHGSKGIDNCLLEWNIGNDVIVSAVPASGKWEVGKWYHIAMTFGNREQKVYINGLLAGSQEVERTSIVAFTAITDSPEWDGFAWEGGKNTTWLSELRLWNVIRTQDQIQENMYQVNPQTEGLLGYWKMDDGQGETFKDYAGDGTKGGGYMQKGPFVWVPDQILTVGQ